MDGWVLSTPHLTRAWTPRKLCPRSQKGLTAFAHQSSISILTIPSHIY